VSDAILSCGAPPEFEAQVPFQSIGIRLHHEATSVDVSLCSEISAAKWII